MDENEKTKLQNILEMLKDLQKQVRRIENEISSLLQGGLEPLDEDEHRRVTVWRFLDLKGGIVDSSDLHHLWVNVLKYNVQGLGGFYVGEGASLVKVSGDRVALTEKGKEKLSEYHEYFDQIDEDLKDAGAV